MTSSGTRIEHDSFGAIDVPSERLWGAQTQRSLLNFDISGERMPMEIILALAAIKRASAAVNRDLGVLDAGKADSIIVQAEIRLLRETGQPISITGSYAGFTDAAASDMSVLGRDITNLFALMGKCQYIPNKRLRAC